MQNIAAWLPGVKKQIEVGPADTPEPGPGELLIEVSQCRSLHDTNSMHTKKENHVSCAIGPYSSLCKNIAYH
jgi:NADPH:quinone reductase-like Zn-dependent oxidoreductase